jgi:hypothetical protein
MSSFSVYKIRNGEAKIWSHSMSSNDLLRAKGWAGTAAWYDAATTVCGDNAGGLAFHIQDFA